MDCREPCPLRPQQAALSQRPDRCGVGARSAGDPQGEARWQQTNGGRTRGAERADVCSQHRLPVACDPQGPAAAEHRQLPLLPLAARWNARPPAPCALRALPREGVARGQSDGGHHRHALERRRRSSVKSAEKGGSRSTRQASMVARRSEARSDTSSSTRKAC